MSYLVSAILASLVISIISLIGIITLMMQEKSLRRILFIFMGFSAGGLMGNAFFHIMPEALETLSAQWVFGLVLVGFSVFFLLERVIHWHHWHKEDHQVHPYAYLNLIGDSIHNFVDGLIIIAAFSHSIPLGIVTTGTIILHEIPQELGDFGVLIHAGLSTRTALMYNFMTALMAVAGVIIGYFLIQQIEALSGMILPVAAGGFIYIAASDLIPELHKEEDMKKSVYSFLFFILGVMLMVAFKMLFPEVA